MSVEEKTQEYVLWVNEERTVLVTLWTKNGQVTVATREDSSHTWGPPIYLERE